MKKRFLIVSPHPDDAELGLGGTILKLKQRGSKVFIVDLTSGEPTPYGTEKKRRKEAQRATEILGVDGRFNLGLENRYLFDTKEARLLLAEKIRLLKPDIIFCPYPQDAHPDHLACTKITEAARFYAKYTKVKLKGKAHYSFYHFYYFCTHLRIIPRVSFLVDISREFSRKMRAIKCYRSQFIENLKNRFIFDYIQVQNRFLGELARSQYAEAIYSKEVIKVNDLSFLL
jgi:bacillithiol biosynthesis deacetylase BshB1